jgi:D-alanine transfer protein
VGVLAAILAIVIVVAGARVTQVYAESLAGQYLRVLAAADLPQKNLTLTFQRAALANSQILPLYGSSELYWESDPRRAAQFFQTAPTGFTVFAIGHAGTGDLYFMQNFAALGHELQGKVLAVEDSSDWFYNPTAIPADQYAGNFSPEIANIFVFDAPISAAVRADGARRMLDFSNTLDNDPLLRAATASLADPSFVHVVAYDLLVPAGRLSSWVSQIQDAAQTIAFIDTSNLRSGFPTQPRSVSWPQELQTASQLTQSQATNNPFGIDNAGFSNVLEGNVPLSQVYSAIVLACFDKSNRDGKVLGPPTDWETTMRSSKAWTDLTLELQVLHELGARPLVYSLPLAGVYDDYSAVSRPARQQLYDRYRAATAAAGITALDLSVFDEDPFFLHDPIDHLSPRGWIFVNRALDVYWHQQSAEPATSALAELARAVPPPNLPARSATCAGPSTPPPPSVSPDAAKLLRHPWGDGQTPAFMVGTDVVLTNLSTPSPVSAPGNSIPVAMQATALTDLQQHYMLDGRLIDLNGAIKSETTLPDDDLQKDPAPKWGVPIDYVLNLPTPASLPRGIYHVDIAAFRIPTWQALPLTATDGSIANSFRIGNVLIAPLDFVPRTNLADYDVTSRALSANLGGELGLVGATSAAVDGNRVSLDLFWRALHQLGDNYTVFVQLLDRNGRLVAQSDGYPWNGQYPTLAWQPGRIVRDSYELAVPAGTPAGPYQIIVGAYRASTLQRLSVLDSTGRATGDDVSLQSLDLP